MNRSFFLTGLLIKSTKTLGRNHSKTEKIYGKKVYTESTISPKTDYESIQGRLN